MSKNVHSQIPPRTDTTSESRPRASYALLALARSNGHARYARGLRSLTAQVTPIARRGKVLAAGRELTLTATGRERTYNERAALLQFADDALSLP